MPEKKKKFLIFDGNAIIHRSFHALPLTMVTKKGQPMNAVYGFAAFLLKAIKEFQPDYLAVTFDVKGPTFRHKEYKLYKAKRVKAPDELYAQIPWAEKIAHALNIPVYKLSGFEADDLIGTITARVAAGVEKIIVTGDMDTLQLIDDDTKVYAMSRGLSESVLYDRSAVRARYGLEPEQMIDFKALRGDPSDNIPGVRGIGEKTAVQILKKFGTLENLYKNLEQDQLSSVTEQGEILSFRLVDLLRARKDEAWQSRHLAEIKRDVDFDFKLKPIVWSDVDEPALVRLLTGLEFKSLLPRVLEILAGHGQKNSRTDQPAEVKFQRDCRQFRYHLIKTEADFKKFFVALRRAKSLVLDTETTGLDPLRCRLLGISFSWRSGEAFFLPAPPENKSQAADLFNYREKADAASGTKTNWLDRLKTVLAGRRQKKIGHNLKFDLRVLRQAGFKISGLDFDTMIASYLLNPGSRQHNLDAVVYTEFGFAKIGKDDLLGRGRDKIGFAEVALDKLAVYSCEDSDFTGRLAARLKAELKKKSLWKLFRELEMPLLPVLADMEDTGIAVDQNRLAAISADLKKIIAKLTRKIHAAAGQTFNINSTQQLREILFVKLGIPPDGVVKNKTGLSTAAEELAKLKDLHPIIPLLGEYRELTKLASTYVDALPALINPRTGRLHTSFNQTVTATGRLSSTEPNLQNIPVRTDWGRKIRQAFVAAPGFHLLSLDYSQIELRLAAHMSGDKKMRAAFRDQLDIHAATAAEIFQVDLAEVTPAMRREAKAVNFGVLYGQGPHGLAQTADMPYYRAKEFIDKYFVVYAGVKKFIDQTITQAGRLGYVQTLSGRRRYLPEINAAARPVRQAAERMAVNTPLQGTAADMIKLAMIRIHKIISQKYAGRVKMCLQVHDELLFEAEADLIRPAAQEFKKIMEQVADLSVPIVADVKAGSNWGDLEKIDLD